MSTITITTTDADRMLNYFREELEKENQRFGVCMKKIEEMEKQSKEETSFFALLTREANKRFQEFAEKAHKHNVDIFSDYIRILTCGSETPEKA